MIYPIYTQDIAKVCPIIFQCLPMICPRYAQDMPKTCPRYAQDMPKICLRYPQDMVGIGKSGFSNMDLCVLLNLVQIRSRRLLIPVVRIVNTYEEPYMNFYEHFINILLKKMLKFDDFPQKTQDMLKIMVGMGKSGV